MVRIVRNLRAVFTSAVLFAAPVDAVEFAPVYGHHYGGSFEDASNGDRFQVGDSPAYGILLDIDDAPGKQLELFLSHQHTHLSTTVGLFASGPRFDLTISYYHIGGLYMLPGYQLVHPFVSGTVGVTSMDPQDANLVAEHHLSFSVGGGVKYFVSRNTGFRLDLRGIYTMLESESAIFCAGSCTVNVRGSGFVQTSISAAVMQRF
ncbi:MAG: hypothetical protein WA632_05970 [Gallionella sp.]